MSADAFAPTQPLPRIPLLKPGIGATFYGNLPRDLDTPQGRDVIRASDIVTLHTLADPSDARHAALVRQINPDARVWLGLPANYLSRMDLAQGRGPVLAEVSRIARVAVSMGVELVELNGEGASDGLTPGDWTYPRADRREQQRLESLARDVLHTLRAALPPTIAIGWTSHDMPGFALPWGAILSRVDVHAPQHYPAQQGAVATQRTLERRIATARGRWEAIADRGEIPDGVVPGGGSWSPYLQGWGHTVGALVWGLCEAPLVRLWACPGSWSPEALSALRAARTLRAAVGVGPDAVERWQTARGLTPDGVVGPRTLSTLVPG